MPLALTAAALLYMLVARLASAANLQAPDGASLLHPASGLALALLLLGGMRYAVSIMAGALLAQAFMLAAPAAALNEALAATVAAALGAWLLRRKGRFSGEGSSLTAFRQLLFYGGGVGAGAGAIVWATGLLLAGQISTDAWAPQLMRNWMGNALGILLLTPLVVLCWRAKDTPKKLRRIPETVLLFTLSFAAGQVIFSGWWSGSLGQYAYAYWTFLFIVWSSVRLGMLTTIGLLCMTALQALWGTHQGLGFFAHDLATSNGFGYWSYVVILSLVGMSLAAYMAERRRQKADLRIAAIAFQCQEGLLITDAQGVVLRANNSYLEISGYAAHEVLGKTSQFLCAHPEGAPDAPSAHGRNYLPHENVQRREWHRRKSGAAYPAWITLTPVADSHARTTNYVLTIIDITALEQQTKLRQDMEQKHREALVQEVHHRIKNNLQGIIGMLREFDHQHPQLHEPVTELVTKVNSIAVIHGLQGRACHEQVRLCELTRAVAAGIESLWQRPVSVDIPDPWRPCLILESEAVPVALVLNELIVNAVKHGDHENTGVHIALRKGGHDDIVQITISNPGQWSQEVMAGHVGLSLVASLMPRHGASLSIKQLAQCVVTQLELRPPVVHSEPSQSP
jgi:PAS domain S-box-containing protein